MAYTTRKSVTATASYDEGLRLYFLNIYNYMAIGLGLTGVVAFFASKIPGVAEAMRGTPLYFILAIGLIGYVFFITARIMKMEKRQALTHFFIYSALMGLLYSSLMLVYIILTLLFISFVIWRLINNDINDNNILLIQLMI